MYSRTQNNDLSSTVAFAPVFRWWVRCLKLKGIKCLRGTTSDSVFLAYWARKEIIRQTFPEVLGFLWSSWHNELKILRKQPCMYLCTKISEVLCTVSWCNYSGFWDYPQSLALIGHFIPHKFLGMTFLCQSLTKPYSDKIPTWTKQRFLSLETSQNQNSPYLKVSCKKYHKPPLRTAELG